MATPASPPPPAYHPYRCLIRLDEQDQPTSSEQPVLSLVLTLRRYPDRTPGQQRVEGELTFDWLNALRRTSGFEHYPWDRRTLLREGQTLLDAGQTLLDLVHQSQTALRTALHERVRSYPTGARCTYSATGYSYELGEVSEGSPQDALGTVIYCATVLAPAAEAGRQILVAEAELAGSDFLGLVQILEPAEEELDLMSVSLAAGGPIELAA
ncbi:MAG TPA: hypothetical protein VEI97_11905 [bacterium]|nr:hypothetical protein [bacterium]